MEKKSLEEQYPERFNKLCEMVLGRWNCPEEREKFYKEWEKSVMNKFPELIDEWDYAENYPWMPWNFSSQSNKPVSWICEKGHKWEVSLNDRVAYNTGCPYCSGRKVLVGFNDLATTNPELAKEWHPTKNGNLTTQDVTSGSHTEVVWICKECGNEWETEIRYRTNLKTGCPKCEKAKQTSFSEQAIFYYLNKVTVAKNRWKKLGKEIDVYLPELHVGIEHGDKRWHPNKDKDMEKVNFFAEKGIRIIRVYGSKKFKRNRVNGDIIEYVYSSSNHASLKWAIETIFELLQIQAPVIDVEGDEMEIRSQYASLKRENNLTTTHPELAKEWHPTKNGTLKPDMFTHGSNTKVWWLGKCGHEWDAIIQSRTRGRGCKVCYEERRKLRAEKP